MDEMEDLERGPKVLAKDTAMLVDSLHDKFREFLEIGGEGQKCTIFRVPDHIRKIGPDLFTPKAVSIGPYHWREPHLSTMEEKKCLILRQLLQNSKASLEECIAELKTLEPQARRCYSETIDMNSNTFVEMMLLDGCFVLEYRKKFGQTSTLFWDVGWGASMISQDLLLIENQIPFFILERLSSLILGEELQPENLKKMFPHLFHDKMVSTKHPPPRNDEIYHLLHLSHYYVVAVKRKLTKTNMDHETDPESEPKSFSLPCATELQDAGIKITKKKPPCDFTDVTFHFQSGVLEIPFLLIEDNTRIVLMNLLALEQCKSLGLRRLISTYLFFMNQVVNTTGDVIILQRQGIIDNLLSNEEEMALFFNQSGQDVSIDHRHYLAKMFKELKTYCESKTHRYRAILMRDYFSNPWAMLSLFAAIFLLILSCASTFYSIFAYYSPPH